MQSIITLEQEHYSSGLERDSEWFLLDYSFQAAFVVASFVL